MSESEHAGVELFKQINEFWNKDDHRGLSPLAVENIGRVLEYTNTPEGEAAVKLRAKELDDAITRFNEKRESGIFEGPDEKESKKLAQEILQPGEKFPLLRETVLDSKAVLPFLLGFRRLTASNHQYYTFLDKMEASNSAQFNSLITGLLVDGYAGFAFRARKFTEGKPSKAGRSDLTAVNTICEMVHSGNLQTEMYYSNWYKPDYGLDPVFCAKIASQFTK